MYKKSISLIILSLISASCGAEPLISSGIYDVEIYYTRDDWPLSLQGTTTEAQWVIDENHPNYTFSVVGSSSEYEGRAQNGLVTFERVRDVSSLYLELNPRKNRLSFTAFGRIEVYLNDFTLITENSIKGTVSD